MDKIEKFKNRLKSKQGHKIYYLAIKIKLNYFQKFAKKSKNAIKKLHFLKKNVLEGHLVYFRRIAFAVFLPQNNFI